MTLNLDLLKVSKMIHNFISTKNKQLFRIIYKDLELSSEELKEIATLLAKKEILRAIKACLIMNY